MKTHALRQTLTCFVLATVTFAIGCSREQSLRNAARDLERRFYLANRANTDSRMQQYERCEAIAEAWLAAGDVEKVKHWKEMSSMYAEGVIRERKIQQMRDEADRGFRQIFGPSWGR
jgi:hypothetical protein